MNGLSRRHFIQSSMVGTGLMIAKSGRASTNDIARHAVIGTGGQGSNHARTFAAQKDLCQVVAVCDVDPKRLSSIAKELSKNNLVMAVDDYRRILDDKSIDTVSIATPDHWHAKIAIEAVMAGKDVYVEKPCCHNIQEGLLLVKAAKKYGRCVQHGTQSRSGKGIQDAMQFMREGGIGNVRAAKAINHQLRGPVGRAKVSEPPQGVNYDRWLGPAPEHSFTKNRWHYQWHWFWDYGCGDAGNDGIHQIDVARWGLGVGLPKSVNGWGGQLFYDDDHETPDTQNVTFEYDDSILIYEMRLWTDYKMEGHDNGNIFYGDRGKVEIGRQGCIAYLEGEEPKKIGGGSSLEENMRNFLQCAGVGDPSKLNAPIEEGFTSAALCHMANINTRIGRGLKVDAESCSFGDDAEANALLTRTYREGYELPSV